MGGQERLRASTLRNWPQRFVHIVVVLAGWAIFFWGWNEVLQRPWETRALWWLIIGSLVVLPLFTIAWILHNLGIHRRKGARTGRPCIKASPSADWNGREIRADWATVSHADLVFIGIEDERKVYRAVTADPLFTQGRAQDGAQPDTSIGEAQDTPPTQIDRHSS